MDELFGEIAALKGGESDMGAQMGEDLLELRKRVLEAREGRESAPAGRDYEEEPVGPQELSSGENYNVWSELRKKYSVQAHKEPNSLMEDPTLRDHMASARDRLREHEQIVRTLPRAEEMRSAYLSVMQRLAALIKDLDEKKMEASSATEACYQQGGYIDALLEGRKPFGFTGAIPKDLLECSPVSGTLKTLREKSNKTAQEVEPVMDFLQGVSELITVLRRDVEIFGDGLMKIVDSLSEERRRQRELIASFNFLTLDEARNQFEFRRDQVLMQASRREGLAAAQQAQMEAKKDAPENPTAAPGVDAEGSPPATATPDVEEPAPKKEGQPPVAASSDPNGELSPESST